MRVLSRCASWGVVLLLAACSDGIGPTDPVPAGLGDVGAAEARAVDLSYIVVLREGTGGVPEVARGLVGQAGGQLGFVYEHAIQGFSATLPAAAVEGLRRNPLVALVELDQEVGIATTQSGATWGLDRVDQRDLPLSGTYTYLATGVGVTTYIVDTGIRVSHQDFGGRTTPGYSSISDGRGTNDCNGHGTHVAGTIGGAAWGIAKGVTLVPVRVLNCNGSGTISGVIAGVDWVTANHAKPAVANMSLGGGASTALDSAVANSIAAGVTYVVAAGNSNANACNYSPARVPAALTVGATTSSDSRASYSNFGSCLDLFAPGTGITSAWATGDLATNTISGTSMASPHVAGAAALVLQVHPLADPASVAQILLSNSTTGKVTSAGAGSPNRLLYTAFIGSGGGSGEGPTNEPPVAAFSANCEYLTCAFDARDSHDPDGSIAAYHWAFGDGTTGTGATRTKTYPAEGNWTVTLTVTDNAGTSATAQQTVSTSSPPAPAISLSVSTTKVRGMSEARLTWSGHSGTVDIFRGGSKVATAGGSSYTDSLGRGSGSQSYQVCNAGTSTCSAIVTVSY